MYILSISALGVSNQVWANATRTLTADPWTPTAFSNEALSIPAAGTADLRPAVGKMRHLSVSPNNIPTANYFVGVYDGTTNAQGGVGSNPPVSEFGNNTVGIGVGNNNAAAKTIAICGYDR